MVIPSLEMVIPSLEMKIGLYVNDFG